MNYHLIRNRDNAYWRPEGMGYTDKVNEAGVYDEYTATQVVFDTHNEHRMEPIKADEGGYILAANLEAALSAAIHALAEVEKRHGPDFKSCQRGAWEDNLAYLRRNGILEVRQ